MERIEGAAVGPCPSSIYLCPLRLHYRQVSAGHGAASARAAWLPRGPRPARPRPSCAFPRPRVAPPTALPVPGARRALGPPLQALPTLGPRAQLRSLLCTLLAGSQTLTRAGAGLEEAIRPLSEHCWCRFFSAQPFPPLRLDSWLIWGILGVVASLLRL